MERMRVDVPVLSPENQRIGVGHILGEEEPNGVRIAPRMAVFMSMSVSIGVRSAVAVTQHSSPLWKSSRAEPSPQAHFVHRPCLSLPL